MRLDLYPEEIVGVQAQRNANALNRMMYLDVQYSTATTRTLKSSHSSSSTDEDQPQQLQQSSTSHRRLRTYNFHE